MDAGGSEQAADRLLGEVLRTDAGVAGPFVDGGVFTVVDGDESKLVEPGGDVALWGDEAGGESTAECDAEDRAIVEGHGTGERGDFAIVDHVEGHAVPGSLQVVEDAAHARVEFF